MKRKSIYILAALAGGLLLGYLLFGGTQSPDGSSTARQAGESSGVGHDHGGEAETSLWTCSMHPQILQPEPGQCPICGMDLIPAESGGDGLAPGQFRMSDNALALADVRTTRLGATTDMERVVKLSGRIQANEKTLATQSAYFAGRIEQLSVNFEGEAVRKGQQLATLYAPELVAAQQELLTAARLKETQPGLYQAVRKKLSLWKLSEPQISKIETSGQVQEYFPVFSDVTGTVSQISVAAGDYVQKGAPLFRIADLGSVWADFDAYEHQIALFREGQVLELQAEALPGEKFEAPVTFVSPVLNAGTRTAVVRAVLPNPSGALKPGMFVSASVRLSASGGQAGIIIPESAVLWTGERSVVYVKPDPARPVFEMREVRLGPVASGGYEVRSGLTGDEEVVVQGAFTLDAAAQLQGKKTMMSPEGGMAPGGHEGHGGMPGMDSASSVALPGEASRVYRAVLEQYLELKDALVEGNTGAVQSAAQRAGQMLESSGSESALGPIAAGFRNVAGTPALEAMRKAFIGLSAEMIALGKRVEGYPSPLYIQYCPMANSNQGAYWISTESAIRNPYYGDAMLTCGEVRETWEP